MYKGLSKLYEWYTTATSLTEAAAREGVLLYRGTLSSHILQELPVFYSATNDLIFFRFSYVCLLFIFSKTFEQGQKKVGICPEPGLAE